jgi:hypothetical protein
MRIERQDLTKLVKLKSKLVKLKGDFQRAGAEVKTEWKPIQAAARHLERVLREVEKASQRLATINRRIPPEAQYSGRGDPDRDSAFDAVIDHLLAWRVHDRKACFRIIARYIVGQELSDDSIDHHFDAQHDRAPRAELIGEGRFTTDALVRHAPEQKPKP